MMLTPRQQTELATEVAKQVVAMLDARGGQPTLVDSLGLANSLGISSSTVDRWVAQGTIPVKLRVGGIRRFSVADVIESLASHKELV